MANYASYTQYNRTGKYSVIIQASATSSLPDVSESMSVNFLAIKQTSGSISTFIESVSPILSRVNELLTMGYEDVTLRRNGIGYITIGEVLTTGNLNSSKIRAFSLPQYYAPSNYNTPSSFVFNRINTSTEYGKIESLTNSVISMYATNTYYSSGIGYCDSIGPTTASNYGSSPFAYDTTNRLICPTSVVTRMSSPLTKFFQIMPVGYNIDIGTVAHGIAVAKVNDNQVYYLDSGTTVTVAFTPDTDYMVDWSNVSITSSVAVALVQTSDTTATFTMPAADVTINPAFTRALTAGVQVSGGHGTASISNAHPTEGDTVTITCYPDSGYEVDTVTSFDAGISQVATNQYQFTMPNVDVLATVTFKETPFFNITVEATSNGNVSADPTSGYSGTTIQLTVAPDAGYSLKHLYVLAGTDSVPTTKVDDTHYTFTLPSFNVVVRALFTDGDPYSPGGNSDPSTPGGTGSFDDNTTPITPPAIPAVSVQDSGLYTIFSLSQSELNSFTNYLWSDLFSLPTVTKYLNNATEHILSLHILPFSVNAGSSREIKFMGIGTGGAGNVVSNQHQQIDCGTVLLEEYYGSALDYNPWTKIKLYVPYCGEIDLDPDEVMGKAVSLKYTIDILTGDCYANIGVSGTTMYQLSGNCAMRLPVSASNWSTIITGVKSAVSIAAGVGAAAMGAVGAGLTAAGASTIGSAYAGGGPAMDVTTMDAGLALQRAGQAVTERTPQVGSTNSYMATMSQKSSFVHTGVQTGGASFMSVQVPYILIKRPRQALPENYNHYVGYPAHYTRTLGNMSGFTQIVDWNPSSIPCTENERTEIDRLLKEGVIL